MGASSLLSLLPLGRRWSEGPDEGFPHASNMPLKTPHLPFGHLLPKGRRGSKPHRRSAFTSTCFASESGIPPSALPGIAPSRGEIRWSAAPPPSTADYFANNGCLGQSKSLLPISPLEGASRAVANGQKSMKSISANEGLSACRAKADGRTEGGVPSPESRNAPATDYAARHYPADDGEWEPTP